MQNQLNLKMTIHLSVEQHSLKISIAWNLAILIGVTMLKATRIDFEEISLLIERHVPVKDVANRNQNSN